MSCNYININNRKTDTFQHVINQGDELDYNLFNGKYINCSNCYNYNPNTNCNTSTNNDLTCDPVNISLIYKPFENKNKIIEKDKISAIYTIPNELNMNK